MTNSTYLLRIGVPALVGIGIVSAVLLGRAGDRRTGTIAAGTTLVAALERPVSTETSRAGDAIELRTVEPIRLDDGSVIPEGVIVRGEVTHARDGGRISGAPELRLWFSELAIDDETYAVTADGFRVIGNSDATESAAEIGGGAVAGAILGGVKGAVAGAAIGTGVAVATEGDHLVLPAGQRLHVRLTNPVSVAYRPNAEQTPQP